ncbi:MAG: tyrosine-protein phosphatase [Planctomycetota bacterium]
MNAESSEQVDEQGAPAEAPQASAPAARSRRGLVALAVLALGLLIGGGVWYQLSQPYHFLTVEQGVLYRSGQLRQEDLERVIAKHGIKTVVNLQPERLNGLAWHDEEEAACRNQGAQLVDMPIEAQVPPSAEQLAAWLKLLEDESRRPILVHCQHGVVRTGMLVAAYEIEFQGKPPAQALEDLPDFGHDLTKSKHDRMRAFIRDYRPTLSK